MLYQGFKHLTGENISIIIYQIFFIKIFTTPKM